MDNKKLRDQFRKLENTRDRENLLIFNQLLVHQNRSLIQISLLAY